MTERRYLWKAAFCSRAWCTKRKHWIEVGFFFYAAADTEMASLSSHGGRLGLCVAMLLDCYRHLKAWASLSREHPCDIGI